MLECNSDEKRRLLPRLFFLSDTEFGQQRLKGYISNLIEKVLDQEDL